MWYSTPALRDIGFWQNSYQLDVYIIKTVIQGKAGIKPAQIIFLLRKELL